MLPKIWSPIMSLRSHKLRPWPATLSLGGVLLLTLLFLAGCGGSEPVPEADHAVGADHDAEMARDAEVALQRSLAEAADKPPVLELDEVIRRTGVDSATTTSLTPRVAALNAALVRLLDLHRTLDGTAVPGAARRVDAEAYAVHLEADTYENDIHRLLTEDQHRRFHAYVEERAEAVGLPLDDSHGAPGVGTMGNIPTVEHPAQAGHADARPAADPAHSHPNDSTRLR